MEESKLPFKKEKNQEQHNIRMANDPEYHSAYSQYRRESEERARERGYIKQPNKKVADMTEEEYATHLEKSRVYRKNNQEKFKTYRSTPERKARKKETDLARREKLRSEGKKTWTPKVGAAAIRAKELAKKRRDENIEAAREKARNYIQNKIDTEDGFYEKLREQNKISSAKYRQNNLEKVRKCKRDSQKRPEAQLYSKLRTRVKQCANSKRIGGAIQIFGCTSHELKEHLSKQFTPEMSWDNMGDYWEIDHILPLCLSKGDFDLAIKLSHYTNLRPLTVQENRSKFTKFIPELWPKDFPYPPEDFSIDRNGIPFFNQASVEGL